MEESSNETLLGAPFDPLSPNSDKHLISPNNITTWSNTQVMKMQEMITKDTCLDVYANSPTSTIKNV